MVWFPPVCEDVDEELASAGPDPGGDLAEQSLVVLHVLEHLDGDHAVEPVLELIRVEGCYITCISNIGTNEPFTITEKELLLGLLRDCEIFVKFRLFQYLIYR